jgi:hypothetical protein
MECSKGNVGSLRLMLNVGPLKNAKMAFPGDIFTLPASRMYQIKIFKVLWAYISVMSFFFQCNC